MTNIITTVKNNQMKKIITDVEGEGLLKLLGDTVTIYCASFIYTGTLSGVNDDCVLLSGAKIVYDTGKASDANWAIVESFPGDWYVMKNMIESFGVFKK